MNIGLVSVTLAIDVIALAAILFRLTSYGFTPNRVAVLGANLLAFGHLAGILWHYVGFIRSKSDLDHLDRWIVRYIPAYDVDSRGCCGIAAGVLVQIEIAQPDKSTVGVPPPVICGVRRKIILWAKFLIN